MFRIAVAIACTFFVLAGCGNGGEAQPKAAGDQVAEAKPEPPPPPEPVVSGTIRTQEAAVIETQGEIEVAKVTVVVGKKLKAVTACYEDALTADPALTGKMTVRFVIAPDGKVSEAAAPMNELPPSVGDCVTEAVKSFVFPKPAGGAVTIEFPFLFSPVEGAARSAKRKDPEVIGGKGAMAPAQVEETVRPNMDRIKACYEQALRQDPKAAGKVTVRVVVEAEGLVYSVQTPVNELPSQVGACMVEIFIAMKFPKPTGGAVTFEMPFLFEPTQR